MVGLREEGDNSDARVATDDGNFLVGRVGALNLRDEARGTYNIEGGDAKETLGIIDALGLEDLFICFVRRLYGT